MPPLRDSPIDFVREGSYIPVFPFSVSIIIARVFQKIFPTLKSAVKPHLRNASGCGFCVPYLSPARLCEGIYARGNPHPLPCCRIETLP